MSRTKKRYGIVWTIIIVTIFSLYSLVLLIVTFFSVSIPY